MKIGKFIIGVGIGALAGMLLAPKKGSELREDIKQQSLKTYESLKNMSKEDVEAVLGQTIESVKKSVDEFDMDEFKSDAKSKLNELEAKLEEFSSKVKNSDQYNKLKEGIVDVSDKVNSKLDEVKNKIADSELNEEDLEDLETEIDAVEEEIDEMIEEIKEEETSED